MCKDQDSKGDRATNEHSSIRLYTHQMATQFLPSTPDFPLLTSIPVESSTKKDTVILFDWDDTLLASSWLSAKGLRPRYTTDQLVIPDAVGKELEKLEKVTIQLLTTALDYGRVVIVTAAETGWVELSGTLFLPGCLDLIESNGISIVSARSTYETLNSREPTQWKIDAFRHEVFNSNEIRTSPLHVLSLGDSVSEREALKSLTQVDASIYAKSMKLISKPTALELCQQAELILSNFDYLCTHAGELDLKLVKP